MRQTQRSPEGPFQTTQGNRLSCRGQEGIRGSEEAVPGPSVFPPREPGVSGDFWGSQEGCQGPFRLSDNQQTEGTFNMGKSRSLESSANAASLLPVKKM